MDASPSESPILLIEDDADTRRTLADILEVSGYTVLSAADGREALDLLRKGVKPCLILLDLMLPVLDGWQLRAMLDREPAWAAVPVIAVSAISVNEARLGALHVDAYLEKPVLLDVLLSAIETYCTSRPIP